jgi:hypothetical protein
LKKLLKNFGSVEKTVETNVVHVGKTVEKTFGLLNKLL